MLWKIAIALCIFCFSIFHSISASNNSLQTTQDGTDAFMELFEVAIEVTRNITHKGYFLSEDMSAQLKLLQQDIIQAATQKIKNIQNKIYQIEKNLDTNGNKTRCDSNASYQQLDKFLSKVKERAENCTIYTEKTVGTVINETIWEMGNLYNDIIQCHFKLLDQCTSNSDNDTCLDDFVISKMNEAKTPLITGYNLKYTSMVNRVISLKLPCMDLLNDEISFYPDLVLDSFNQCTDAELLNWPPIC